MKIWYILSICFITQATIVRFPPWKTPPKARGGFVSAFIPSKNFIVFFGGFQGSLFYNDIWSFDITLLIWQEIFPDCDSIPCKIYAAPRAYYGAFVRPVNERYYIFGGKNSENIKSDFWEFDFYTLQWTKLLTVSEPISRNGFAFCYYVRSSIEYFAVFGGRSLNRYDLVDLQM